MTRLEALNIMQLGSNFSEQELKSITGVRLIIAEVIRALLGDIFVRIFYYLESLNRV